MTYTIAEAAERCGLTAHTLRYYDKEGLLPYVDRDEIGNRLFKESDFGWLNIINCLKKSGMPIKQIKNYIDWCIEGDSTLEIRYETMKEHKRNIENQMEALEGFMETIDYKLWYYETAIEAGTEAIHKTKEEAPGIRKAI